MNKKLAFLSLIPFLSMIALTLSCRFKLDKGQISKKDFYRYLYIGSLIALLPSVLIALAWGLAFNSGILDPMGIYSVFIVLAALGYCFNAVYLWWGNKIFK